MPSLVLVTAPTEEPVTIDEVKYELRDAPNEDDTYIRGLITASRRYCETQLKRQFCTATWDYRLDCFPSWEFELPLPPLQSVSSITYIDTGGTSTVFSSANYLVDIYSEPGRITPVWNENWPSARYQNNALVVRFVAGYGAAYQVPDSIKQAIRMRVRMMYEGCPEDDFNRVTNGILSPDVWGCYA